MTVRYVDLAARHADVAPDVEARVIDVLRSGRYVGGPVVDEVERVAAALFGRRGAVGTSSGTDALALGLQAAGVRPGDEVIVPALTFFATAGAVLAIGAVPVIADVREDACLDPDAARAALTARTAAVVPVHLYGTLARDPELGVPVVDDAAQGVGGDPPRSVGALTAVSAYPTKTWGAAGDAGFVVGDDDERLAVVRALANHGVREAHVHASTGGLAGRNARLDALQAAVLLAHAPRLEARVARRRAIAARYDTGLPPAARAVPRDAGSPVHVYPVLVERRDAVREALSNRGVETAIYYPRSLVHQPALAAYVRTAAPVADRIATSTLALPIHEGLAEHEVDRVLEALCEVVR